MSAEAAVLCISRCIKLHLFSCDHLGKLLRLKFGTIRPEEEGEDLQAKTFQEAVLGFGLPGSSRVPRGPWRAWSDHLI